MSNPTDLDNDGVVDGHDPEGIDHRITKDKGHVIGGYTVLGTLGHGAGSTIYAVEDGEGGIFAAKHVERRGTEDDRFVRQAINEYDQASKFDHPILRRAFKLIRERNLMRLKEVVVVLELVNGETLEHLRQDDPLPTLRIMLDVARGLKAMHEAGHVHADIKPNNILITRDRRVKVIDFGQSCAIDTIKERIQGTPDYIAPEQMTRSPITPRTDIFNFGATIYWALTGQNIPTMFPKEGQAADAIRIATKPKPPHVLNDRVPEALSDLVLDCVAKEPGDRPESIGQVIFRLESIETELRGDVPGTGSGLDELEINADEIVASSSDSFGDAELGPEDTDAALALAEEDKEPTLGSMLPGKMAPTDEVQVLLVEDNPGDAALVVSALDEEANDLHSPFEVKTVGNLADALTALKEKQFHAILLDLSLPDSRGVDTLIDMHSQAKAVPIIVLSGLENQYAMLDALKKGAQEFLNKEQLDPQMLSRTILHAIQRNRIQMRLIELAADRAESAERRRRKLKDLQASRKRYKTIVQSMPDGLVIVSQKGELLFANEAAQELFHGQDMKFKPRGPKVETDTGQLSPVVITTPDGKQLNAELHSIMIEWRDQPAMLVCIRRVYR